MTTFAYKAYDARGKPFKGTIECADRDAAFEWLRKRGHRPVSLAEAQPAQFTEPWWQRELFSGGGLSTDDLTSFTREVATLLHADLPIDEALEIIQLRRGVPVRVRNFALRMLDAIRGGKSFSRALAHEASSVPEFYWRLVAAGEASGSLHDIIADLAGYLERTILVRRRISSALIYPALLLGAAGMAIVIVTLVLVPAVAPLFADAGVPLPPLLAVLNGTQALLRTHWIMTLAAILIGVFAVIVGRRSRAYTRMRDRGLLKLPLAGDMIMSRETDRLCRILGTLLQNGVPLVEALRSASRTLGNSLHQEAIARAAERISEGRSLSQDMAATGLFTDLAIRFVAVGERTGQLDAMLQKSADIHEQDLQNRIDKMVQFVGPVLTLLIGGFAGGLIVSVLNAILSINDLTLR